MLQSFNFDIVIIITFLFLIIIGIYRGFYQQLFTTIALVIPLIIIFFSKDKILSMLTPLKIYQDILNSIHKMTRYFMNVSIQGLESFLIILFTVTLCIIIFKLIFYPLKKRYNFHANNVLSHILGGILGFVGAISIIVIMFTIISPLTDFPWTSPLTSFLLKYLPEVFKGGFAL